MCNLSITILCVRLVHKSGMNTINMRTEEGLVNNTWKVETVLGNFTEVAFETRYPAEG